MANMVDTMNVKDEATVAVSLISHDSDDLILARQGKKQQLKRAFGFWSMLGLTVTMMVSWEAIFIINSIELLSAGPVGLLYGFVFCFFGTLAAAMSMAEMVSIAPTNAGQYHWVAMLAPVKWRVFLSWLTGWISVVGWNAAVASAAYLSSTMVQGLVVLNHPDYTPKRWHATLIFYAIVFVCLSVNTVGARLLPQIEAVILIFHVACFFGILIPLIHLAPKTDAKTVFTQYFNATGWNNSSVAWLIGLQGTVFAFLGYDGPCHMAEEVKNATTTVPWVMLTGILLNGAMTLAAVLAFLFTMGDIESALMSPTGYDFMQIFYNVTGSVASSTAMSAFLTSFGIFATIALLTGASHITWALARDRGLPFSPFFSKVHYALPIRAILLSATISLLLALINIGSTAALNALLSITVAGLSFTYFLPIALLLSHRIRSTDIAWGPWRMPNAVGFVVNIFALIFLFVSALFSFFPFSLPVTPANMNYSCLVVGAAVIFGVIYYYFRARKSYTGPVVDVEVDEMRQGSDRVEGPL